MPKIKSKHFLIYSTIVFVISLTQRTYCTDLNCGELGSGFMCLLVGILGIQEGGIYLTWIANPLLFLAYLSYKKYSKTSLLLGTIGLITGSSFLTFDKIIIDEAGHIGTITGYCFGYWLWLSSMMILIIGNIINIKQKATANTV